jgi:tetratricopeptide (TPR) repeat protein
MIESELKNYPIGQQLSDPLLLSLNIRKVHHKMFFSPIEEVWNTMLGLLKNTDLEKMSAFHGEILVMMGGNLGTLRGNYKEGREYLIKAIRLGESTGDHYLMTRALRKYFDFLRYEGHFKFAKKCWDKAWALSESKQRTRQGIYMLCSYGDMERQQGNFDGASKHLQEALKASEDTYIPGWIGHCHLALAELALDKNDLVAARKELDLAKSFYQVAHQEWGIMHANAGEVRLMQKEGGEWEPLLEEITEKAESLGYTKDIEYFKALASGDKIDNCLMFL